MRQQHKGFDRGPFTVDNLVRLAKHAAELEGLAGDRIIATAELRQPADGNATVIRTEYNAVFPTLGLQAYTEAPQLNDTMPHVQQPYGELTQPSQHLTS